MAADAAGITTDQLSRYIREDNQPRLVPMAKLCHAAGVTVEWLVSGEHETQPEPLRKAAEFEKEDDAFVHVPLYDVEAAAGHGSFVAAEPVLGHYAFRRDFIRQHGWQVDQLALIWSRGESMPGVIEDGQLVLINLAVTSVRREGVYVLRMDEQLVIKVVQPDHRGNLLIHSTSSLYRDITVPRDQIHELDVVAQAIWTDQLL